MIKNNYDTFIEYFIDLRVFFAHLFKYFNEKRVPYFLQVTQATSLY